MGTDLLTYVGDTVRHGGSALDNTAPGAHGDAIGGAGPLTLQTRGDELLGGAAGGFAGPSEWKGAGFGGGVDGSYHDDHGGFVNGYAGLGLGGAGTTWSAHGRTGASGAAGAVAPIGIAGGGAGRGGSLDTTLYSGAGGSAYEYKRGADEGMGFSATAVPLGLGNTNLGLEGPGGMINAHADNAYLDRLQVSADAGRTGNTIHSNAAANLGMGIDGFNGSVQTAGGSTLTAGAGGVSYGVGGSLAGEYDTATGGFDVKGSANEGLDARDLSLGFSHGPFAANAHAGEVQYGVNGTGGVAWDPARGRATANVDGRGGGVNVQNVDVSGGVPGAATVTGHLGEFSNDVMVKGDAAIDANGMRVHGDVDGDGVRLNQASVTGTFGSGRNAVGVHADADSLGTTNDVHGAFAELNWAGKRPGLHAGFTDAAVGGTWSGQNVNAGLSGPNGLDLRAHADDFTTGGTMERGTLDIDGNGVTAGLGHGEYRDFDARGVTADANYRAAQAHAAAGEIGINKTEVSDASLHLDRSGLDIAAGHASFDQGYLNNARASLGVDDAFTASASVGEGSANHVSADNAYLRANSNGWEGGLRNGQYDQLAGRNVNANLDIANGAGSLGAHADSAALNTVRVGQLDASTDLRNAHVDAHDVDAAQFHGTGLAANVTAGDYGANVGAQELAINQAHAQHAQAQTSDYFTRGEAQLEGGTFDQVNARGAHAGVSSGGHEVAGLTTDARVGGAVDHAGASYNLRQMSAEASFRNASYGASLANTDVNIGGHHVAVPNVGAHVNASGGAGANLRHGTAHANLSLAGSSANLGGHQITAPEWVQAGADVNLRRGAANVNLGGATGVGAHMDMSRGELSFDAAGHHLDVAQGVRDGWHAVSDW